MGKFFSGLELLAERDKLPPPVRHDPPDSFLSFTNLFICDCQPPPPVPKAPKGRSVKALPESWGKPRPVHKGKAASTREYPSLFVPRSRRSLHICLPASSSRTKQASLARSSPVSSSREASVANDDNEERESGSDQTAEGSDIAQLDGNTDESERESSVPAPRRARKPKTVSPPPIKPTASAKRPPPKKQAPVVEIVAPKPLTRAQSARKRGHSQEASTSSKRPRKGDEGRAPVTPPPKPPARVSSKTIKGASGSQTVRPEVQEAPSAAKKSSKPTKAAKSTADSRRVGTEAPEAPTTAAEPPLIEHETTLDPPSKGNPVEVRLPPPSPPRIPLVRLKALHVALVPVSFCNELLS